MIDALLQGLALVLQWHAFSLMLVGMALGFVVGARIEVGYIPPEEVVKMFNGLLDQPPEVQKEMVKYIKFGS